jgi:hypothetical protein
MHRHQQKLTDFPRSMKEYRLKVAEHRSKEIEERRQRAKTYALQRAKQMLMNEQETNSYIFDAMLQSTWDYNEGRPYKNLEPIMKDTHITIKPQSLLHSTIHKI